MTLRLDIDRNDSFGELVSLFNKIRQNAIVFLIGAAIVIFLPVVHFGIYYYSWVPYKGEVDREECQCDCFDTIFKGNYEWRPSYYKHVYFNCTSETMMIWVMTILSCLVFYESLSYVIKLAWTGSLRVSMLILYLSSIYPHYYGWWGFFNYYNDDFYEQFWHQVFFSVTELCSTAMVVHFCDVKNKISVWKLLIIVNISLVHVLVGSMDQFISNVLLYQAEGFRIARDNGLLLPDVLHLVVCCAQLRTMKKNKQMLVTMEHVICSFIMTISLLVIGKSL